MEHGNPLLAKICGQIAQDEGYHAQVYIQFVRTFFEKDPDGMMQALWQMLQRGIVMPAHNMREVDPNGNVLRPGETYEYFSNIAQQLGVYTAKDYAAISARLLTEWNIRTVPFPGLSDAGREAQQKILRRQKALDLMATRDRKKEIPQRRTSWLVHG